MVTLLLVTIYLAFVSMGLPDSLLGSAWPVMRGALGLGTQMAGYVSLAVSVCTVISSMAASRAIARWGTGRVTAFSVALTAVALFGFSAAPNFLFLILFAIPQGLGAGAIDAALSNYVALHFKAKHMNWLHCCWGVGAMASPAIMSAFLAAGENWRGGYRAVGFVQTGLLLVLVISLPLWRMHARKARAAGEEIESDVVPNREVLRMRGAKSTILSMLFYNGYEAATGLWAATFFASARGLSSDVAAKYACGFFLGIMAGRVAAGFLSERYSGRILIRVGCAVAAVGLALFIIPLPGLMPAVALFLFGAGGAPVYPCTVNMTPARFGQRASQSVVGTELAGAYVGTTTLPLITGYLARLLGEGVIPWVILFLFLCMVVCCEWVNRVLPEEQT